MLEHARKKTTTPKHTGKRQDHLLLVYSICSFIFNFFLSFSLALFHRSPPSIIPSSYFSSSVVLFFFFRAALLSRPFLQHHSSGNISRQTDHLGVRPVNVLIVIYSWTEFKKSFSLLTTWSWRPREGKKRRGKKKVCTISFSLTANGVSLGLCQPQILIQF